jgi:hypothetical protein
VGLTRAEERAAWYLAGLFDGEGWVAARSINIGNKDESILATTMMALETLGFHYTWTDNRDDGLTVIRIATRSEAERFGHVVPFQCRAKRAKWEALCALRRCLKPHERPIDRIIELKADGLTQRSIAIEMGIGHTTLKTWCREANITWV